MSLSFAGLVIIAAAWLVQLVFSWNGNRTIHPIFIVFYMLGVLALIISDYIGTKALSYFELLTLVAAGLLFWRIVTVKNK
jgi:hypothetical protein